MAVIAAGARAQDLPIVAVTAISDYPALTACRDGVRDALKIAGYEDGKTIRFVYESGDGSLGSATEVARRLAQQKPKVVVPISTPSAQAVLRSTIGTPIVFVAVTDPLGAQLVQNLQNPGGLVTGVSDLAPVKKQIEMIRNFQPTASRIGLIYNPRETNSYTLVDLMKVVAQTIPMTVAEARVTNSADVRAAAESLIGKADLIFIPTDNTVVTAFDAVVEVAARNRLPVYAGDPELVKRGAMAAVGVDYYKVGFQAGNIVARVLNGEAPGRISVGVAQDTIFYVNATVAETLDISVPDRVLTSANEVVR